MEGNNALDKRPYIVSVVPKDISNKLIGWQ